MEATKIFARAKDKGSDIVMLDTPPDYIIVKILRSISNHDWPADLDLDTNDLEYFTIPIGLHTRGENNSVQIGSSHGIRASYYNFETKPLCLKASSLGAWHSRDGQWPESIWSRTTGLTSGYSN